MHETNILKLRYNPQKTMYCDISLEHEVLIFIVCAKKLCIVKDSTAINGVSSLGCNHSAIDTATQGKDGDKVTV
jgi:hypothetical protein